MASFMPSFAMVHITRYFLFRLRSTSLTLLMNAASIVLFGSLFYYAATTQLVGYPYLATAIVLCSFFKCLYFAGISYHKILEVSLKDTAYYEFILFMAMNIAVVIFSFAVDFFSLFQADHFCLKGIPPDSSLFESMFDCFYFSVLNFSFFGYGDIIPASIPAKIIMMFETLLSFMAVILVLSDFISLKNSIYERSKKKNKQT